MIKFFHKLFNPHCEHCKDEYRDSMICDSCEILKEQLALLNHTNEQLMKRLLDKPEEVNQAPPTLSVVKPKGSIPWAVRRQLLESEDRKRAELLQRAPIPIHFSDTKNITTENLEIQLGVADGGYEKSNPGDVN